jgi:hypothetical protein
MPLPDIDQVVDPVTVREEAADRIEARTVVRDFFMDQTVPDGAGAEYEIPVPAQELQEPEEVDPGTDVSYDREGFERPRIARSIFKAGSAIPEEDINDNIFDLLSSHLDGHAQNMSQKLDREAFAVLDQATPSANAVSADGGADGNMTFEDINAGVHTLLERDENGYSADMALIGSSAKEDLINDLADRGTDLGDEAVQSGVIGEYAGVTYAFTNNVTLGADEAIVVDTSEFGFEGEFQAVSTDQTTDFDSESVKMKIKAAYGWTTKHSAAAVRVEG